MGIIIFTDTYQRRVASVQWVAPFTGAIVTDPSKLDIDHLVPLDIDHRSGGQAWDSDRKRAYANDLTNPAHLADVTAGGVPSSAWRRPKATCSGVFRDFFMGRSSFSSQFRSSHKNRISTGTVFWGQRHQDWRPAWYALANWAMSGRQLVFLIPHAPVAHRLVPGGVGLYRRRK